MNEKTAPSPLRVAVYCRICADWDEEDSALSVQRDHYAKMIDENPDWVMAGCFVDRKQSGKPAERRAGFQRMLRRCRQGEIDLILTKNISRFARNTLDVIKYTRELRNLGVSVIFEKENINSIYPESEFLITLYGAFAQSESESISKNVSWGKHQAMKAGRAIIQYKRLLGYVKGENGKPKIVPDQAETIRFIYDRYLAGDTLRALKARLEADGVPYITGEASWNISGLQSILQNEKYCGDVLLQKTFIQDCISKKVIKNTGQLPKVLIQDHHEGIVSREMFDAVQAETARRRAVAASTKKSAPTGLGKYSGKHALTSLLVCGECGTPYRRVVWTQKELKRPVWRCVNRLDYGKRVCKHSPTLDEKPLQQAILSAINSLMRQKDELLDEVSDELAQELTPYSGEVMSLGDIDRAVENLSKQFDQLIQETGGEENLMDNMEQFQNITSQLAALKERRNRVLNLRAENSQMTWRLQRAAAVMREAPAEITEWDERLIYQLVEEVKVMSADQLLIRFRNGAVVEQPLGSREAVA